MAVSGAALQGIFKNPMADPGIIGVSSGAAVGAVIILSLGFASYSLLMLPIFSFIGGLSAAFLVFLISRLASSSTSSSFILSGLAVSTFLNSVISLIILSSKKFGELTSILNWLAGGFQDARWEHVYMTFPIVLTALPFLIFYSNRINILSLSDDSAKSLGLNVNKDKFIILINIIPCFLFSQLDHTSPEELGISYHKLEKISQISKRLVDDNKVSNITTNWSAQAWGPELIARDIGANFFDGCVEAKLPIDNVKISTKHDQVVVSSMKTKFSLRKLFFLG